MQKNLQEEMSKLRYLLDKKEIDYIDCISSFNNNIYENISFKKDDIKFTVSRHEHHNYKGVFLFELIRVDKVSSTSEEYGYFKQIFNLPILNNNQKRDLLSFNGDYEIDYDKNYLSSLSILF